MEENATRKKLKSGSSEYDREPLAVQTVSESHLLGFSVNNINKIFSLLCPFIVSNKYLLQLQYFKKVSTYDSATLNPEHLSLVALLNED